MSLTGYRTLDRTGLVVSPDWNFVLFVKPLESVDISSLFHSSFVAIAEYSNVVNVFLQRSSCLATVTCPQASDASLVPFTRRTFP